MKFLVPVVILAVLWAFTGALVGFGIDRLYGTEWILPCGALNVIIGLGLLLLATRNETARKIFYEVQVTRMKAAFSLQFSGHCRSQSV